MDLPGPSSSRSTASLAGINLHIIPVIVHRGDDDRVRTMPGKGILAVGQQQFLVAAPMELFVFVMDAANRADELGKFTIPFI